VAPIRVQQDRLEIRVGPLRQLFSELCAIAAAEGFEILEINGYRIGGANPNRVVDLRLTAGRFG
jgi:hypothetical protein